MKINYLLLIFTILFSKTIYAQTNLKSVVKNATTKAPVPFATIKFDEQSGVMANEEGVFKIENDQVLKDSISISSIGYETLKVAPVNLDTVTYLKPEVLELATVFVTDKNLSIDQIIDSIQINLAKNYPQKHVQNQFFCREATTQRILNKDLGFKKSTIKEIDKHLVDSIAESLPSTTSWFVETAGSYVSDSKNKLKLTIAKALIIENDQQSKTLAEYSESIKALLKRNLKPDSYLKIKSGIVGTKIPLDSIITDKTTDKKRFENYENNYFVKHRTENYTKLISETFSNRKLPLDVFSNRNDYYFELLGFQEFKEEIVYKITFQPKEEEGFQGAFYVNITDFSVLQVTYQSTAKVYDSKFNLFGIHFNHTAHKGTIQYEKNSLGYYFPKYISIEDTELFTIQRPLKIIEKNKNVKGRRKQNELKLALNFAIQSTLKKQLINYNSKEITADSFKNQEASTSVKVNKRSAYDSEFWKGTTVLEPNTALQEFNATTD